MNKHTHTHYCAVCGEPLDDAVWPYAACEPCGKKPCAHGNPPGECNACDVAGDLEHDARREGR